MAHLLVESGPFRGRSFPLRHARTCLGRNAYLRDILSLDLGVSREHAAIVCEQHGYSLEDLKSRHGTLLNGQLLMCKEYLHDQDRIQLSGITLTFFQGDSQLDQGRVIAAPPPATVLVDDDSTASVQQQVDMSSGVRTTSNHAGVVKPLLKMIGSLTSTEDPDKILENLLEALFQVFPRAQRGFVGTIEKDREIGAAAVRFRKDCQQKHVPVSRRIAELATEGRKALLVQDAIIDSKLADSDSVFTNEIRSVMCVPLIDNNDQPLGIIQLDTPSPHEQFGPDDLQLLADLAPQAAFVLKFKELHSRVVKAVRLESDLRIAQSVHERLMPQKDPQIDGYRFYSFYRAARILGGDYYNYVHLREGRLAIILADVEGKGMPAALFVARLAGELRHLLEAEDNLVRIVERLNDSFAEDEEGRFLTILLLLLDPQSHTVSFVNAGHWDPVLRHTDHLAESIGRDAGGRPVGIFAHETYQLSECRLAPGEMLVIFSDGFTDAVDKTHQQFGHARLLAEIGEAHPDHLGPNVVNAVLQHVGQSEQVDDMTLICLQRLVRQEPERDVAVDRDQGGTGRE